MELAEGEVTIEIKKPETIVLLAFLGILLFMELQVSFSTPISFGDEGFHTRMAQWIGQNVEYPVWTPFTQSLAGKAGFDRPPFWNILEAGFFWLFGFSEVIPRLLTPFVSVLGGLALYLGAKRFYGERVGFLAGVLLATFPSVVTYALIFYTQLLTIFFMSMFIVTLAMAMSTGRKLHMLAAGAFGALAFLTNVVGAAAYIVVAVFLSYELLKGGRPLELVRKYWLAVLLMALLPSTLLIRNYASYGTPLCYSFPILSNVFSTAGCNVNTNVFTAQYSYAGRTVQTGTESSVFSIGVVSYLDFAYGNVWLIIIAFAGGLMFLTTPISKAWSEGVTLPQIEPMDFMSLAMIAIYAFLFLSGGITARAEDTARYSLIWAPIIALVAACFLNESYLFLKKYQKYLALVVFAAVLYLGWTVAAAKIAAMYQVKQFSPLFFEACDWIKANTPQDLVISTVWTYRTAYSCQRNVVASLADMALSNNVTHILEVTKAVGITHIFVQKFSLSDQSLSESYPISYVRLLEANPDHFKKVYENGPSLEQCIQQGGCDGNIVYEIVY